ncbi:hypothetical protein JHL18_18775 [Clostridium sp. YIM B02505]|uniref:Uncharacterized protein n=2 Tax=Clostridium yunnanense TaxID=2800325 RepID=A0ABS1ETP8_9CLOT|nr:hypothetical protein [Clostridium yunnanense]
MIDLISNMLTSINTSNIAPLLINAEKIVGPRSLRVVMINIVDWLKLEYKRETQKRPSKPLLLNYNYDWCNNVKTLIESDCIFSQVFSVCEGSLYYNKSLDDSSISEARRLCFEGFNPPEFTTMRKK